MKLTSTGPTKGNDVAISVFGCGEGNIIHEFFFQKIV